MGDQVKQIQALPPTHPLYPGPNLQDTTSINLASTHIKVGPLNTRPPSQTVQDRIPSNIKLNARPFPPSSFTLEKAETIEDDPSASINAQNDSGKKRSTKKKVRKGADRQLPAKIIEELPESALYNKLLDLEKRIDYTIFRKRLEIQDASRSPSKIKRTLRMYITSKFFGQSESSNSYSSWLLKIEGKILSDPTLAKSDAVKTKKKFSSFFDRIFILSNDETLPREQQFIEWKRSLDTVESDGFEIKRAGSRNVQCKIVMFLNYQPAQFKLAAGFSNLLGLHTATRSEIIAAFWQYLKMNKLQDKMDHSLIRNNEELQQLFGCTHMTFSSLAERMAPFLSPPDPVELHYQIRTEAECQEPLCYDLSVEIPDPGSQTSLQNFLMSDAECKKISECDAVIADLLAKIKDHKEKCDFMRGLVEDPVGFIDKWIASQSRDFQFAGEVPGSYEEERRADYYAKPWVEEAVWKYLGERMQKKRMQLEQTMNELRSGGG
ncbi:brahma-associated protein of 60 kDa-like [Zophobas morio]|uniref:brahma-associated protein of 60 kDa-like n=1 Tax=Zophobas morio TaxID=2755281 RepID=UPI0030838EAA